MNFEQGLRALLAGRTVARKVWGGDWLEYRDNGAWVREPTIFRCRNLNNQTYDDAMQSMRWTPEQTDILATDWSIGYSKRSGDK